MNITPEQLASVPRIVCCDRIHGRQRGGFIGHVARMDTEYTEILSYSCPMNMGRICCYWWICSYLSDSGDKIAFNTSLVFCPCILKFAHTQCRGQQILANPPLTRTPLLTQGLGQPPTLYGVQLCIPEKSLTHCGCHILWDNFVPVVFLHPLPLCLCFLSRNKT